MSEPQEGDTRLDEKMYVYSLVYCTGKTPCVVSDEQKRGDFHGHWRGGKAVTLADVLAPYREHAERAEAEYKKLDKYTNERERRVISLENQKFTLIADLDAARAEAARVRLAWEEAECELQRTRIERDAARAEILEARAALTGTPKEVK